MYEKDKNKQKEWQQATKSLNYCIGRAQIGILRGQL
jgi:hypothetical protein